MSVQIPLDSMTVEEKLRAMEDIWADLRKQPDDIPSPDWHRDVLSAREQQGNDGPSVYEDWTVARERIRKKTENDLVRIHAVLDCRQDPDGIQKRFQPQSP